MKIQITLENHKSLLYKLEKLVPKTLQSDLKFAEIKNIEKLEKSILQKGFNTIIYLWQDENETHISDGNHRVIALNNLIKKGHQITEVPVIFQKANSLKEAKALILSNSIKVAKISKMSLANYFEENSFSIDEIKEELESFTDLAIDTDDLLAMSMENNIEENGETFEEEEDQDTPEKFYLIATFDTESERQVILDNNPKLQVNFQTCSSKDIKFK